MTKRIAAAALAAALSLPASAAELWGVVNVASWHDNQECAICPNGKPNQANWGGGVELRLAPQWAIAAGGYRNTYGHGTAYALGLWQPVTAGPASAGLFAGLATGYRDDYQCHSNVCPVAGLMFSLTGQRVGLNVMVVPAISAKDTTVFGLQLKARIA